MHLRTREMSRRCTARCPRALRLAARESLVGRFGAGEARLGATRGLRRQQPEPTLRQLAGVGSSRVQRVGDRALPEERRLAGRGDRKRIWRELQVQQDPSGERPVGDRRDHGTRCITPRTDRDSRSEHTLEQLSPGAVSAARDGLVRVGSRDARRACSAATVTPSSVQHVYVDLDIRVELRERVQRGLAQ